MNIKQRLFVNNNVSSARNACCSIEEKEPAINLLLIQNILRGNTTTPIACSTSCCRERCGNRSGLFEKQSER